MADHERSAVFSLVVAASLARRRHQAGGCAKPTLSSRSSRSGWRWNTILSLIFWLSFWTQSPYARAQTVPLPNIPNRTFNITSAPYNAVGDGIATNTTAIQSAINACTSAGGGTVLVPAGTFLCGPITLGKSNNLQLASGALLRMLPFGSYPTNAPAFITASSINDVQISGSGAVDGQGQPWLAAFATNSSLARPVMLNMTKCTRLAVLGVAFTNAPIMHLTIKNNTSATIQGNHHLHHLPLQELPTELILRQLGLLYVEGNNISDGDDVIAIGSSASFSAETSSSQIVFSATVTVCPWAAP